MNKQSLISGEIKASWIILAVFILIVGGVFFWAGPFRGSQVSSQVSSQPEERVAGADITVPNQEAIKSFDIEGKPFEFSIKEIKVKEGDKVRINFKNTQGTHDFTIEEFDAHTKMLQVGETDSVEFVADKKGTFEYYCSVGNGFHRQQGMVGKLIVE
ncbi:hypothetical protein A3A14_01985 [Candidatus Daviesbacteria bacterium RIFCSPLOWO2_01_FULL_43_38]|uniref:EfeO-type cupredoxin-like domain-containing protein n=3 Tax=Candidatus Daviesiibacteriota TaxID=1752718 RepID=A0A1F5K7P9_9BACT|nr:MAG: Plastocyanin [Candidatus Daviesbacteria bacterium GW2011_GWA1_42_6]OGE19821.1 MAG: hypothetical protein A2874_02745 [Candidatus Daviesbacteria bacterium RIFCSPHIGHO2_01_FULL_43_17]OGE36967.1 MAG: hypothetical protein A3E45_01860 [Candidatus Daviesbacteria bacterium RIFCSPHIGHO2_12_FULL_43_11]OGE63624.1 MAG: hypothetical protein A3A14_01985 [Candidatus Daviesbacteria bacterium RIFCSPLOWO2_01_FULL_43_38]